MLLSVIVPVYNVEGYLDRCVQSIIDQTYTEMEIILVNDGSTDRSGGLCEKWKQKDERITVICKKNGGLSSARNSGIDVAKGGLLTFVDSDDFIGPDMYGTMIEALIRTKKDVACCGRIIDIWGKYEKKEFISEEEKIYDKEEAIREVLLLDKIDVSVCDKIFRRDLFENIRFPEGRISEDAAIIFGLFDRSNGVVHVGKAFYHYVYRKDSISKISYDHKKYDMYTNCINTEIFIRDSHPCLSKECKIYCCRMTLDLLQDMYREKNSIKRYRSDHIKYRKTFQKGLIFLLSSTDLKWKVKVKGVIMFVHCFGLFLFLKKNLERLVYGNEEDK